MSSQYAGPLGIALYDHTSGMCVGVITPQGNVEADVSESILLEPMPLDEAGEVFDTENPARRIVRRGPAVGRFRDEDISEWLRMADGTRFEYEGLAGDPIDVNKLRFGCLVVMPGLLYSLKDDEPPVVPSRIIRRIPSDPQD